MNRIATLLILAVLAAGCYDDYIKDYDYDGVYFPYQEDVRTFVVGEGMKIKFGAALGGVRDNDRDRLVTYALDNSLISPATLALLQASPAAYVKNAFAGVSELKLLPVNYYSLSDNSRIVIKQGEHSGTVTLTPDSAKFLSDPATLTATYAIPLRITQADADTVLKSKEYAVIGLKYENMLFGNYWHGGVTIVKDATGNAIDTLLYPTTIPSPEAKIWKLTTAGPFNLTTNGVSDVSSSTNPEMQLTLNGGTITISAVEGATFEVVPDGQSAFNQAKLLQDRKIFLNYKYQNDAGNWCYAKDTLTFRNRIRDGVNEWQDENPSHYN
ncbi:MAG: DUF1735 domain-containing protein [Mangrovibacterium sp.]